MTVQELIDSGIFGVVNAGEGLEREITKPFCCDLLSIAMGRAPFGCAWVTVMGNMNTLAARKKAVDQEITVLKTEEPIFEAALAVWNKLQAGAHEEP